MKKGQLHTDIQNTAAYNASGSNLTLGVGSQLRNSSAGVGSASGSASSTSTGGISGVAGNANARTGDAGTGLAPIFNQDRVRADVQAQIQITAQVGPRASAAAGSYADGRYNDALRRGDTAEMQLWQEGGAGRVGLHALVGGLTGGADGALGAASSAVVAPQTVDMLQALGVPPEMSRSIVPLMGAAVGYGTGGVGGAVTGFNEADNNASGSIARRAAVPMLQLCSSSVQCAAFFGSAAGVAGGGALLNQISNRAADLQQQNPHLTDNAAFVMALSERTAGAFVNTISSWFAPTPNSGPSTTTSPGIPLPPPAPLVTPANAPAPASSNNTGGTQLDQPQGPVTTGDSPIAQPAAGSNITATPAATPQGPGIVISQNSNPNAQNAAGAPDNTRIVAGVTVTDIRTGLSQTGNVNLGPTLDRIANGTRDSHRNDGTQFNNTPKEPKDMTLPSQPPGYYTEHVVRTPGVNAVGPQRIVTGQNGEIYYTPNHYQTFIPLNSRTPAPLQPKKP